METENFFRNKSLRWFLTILLWSVCSFSSENVQNNHLHTKLFKYNLILSFQFSSVQLLSHLQLFATPLTAARQDSLSITNSQSWLKLMSMESTMPINHVILCHPLLLPSSIFPHIRVFSDESVLHIRCPNIRVSASASVHLMSIQDWFPLGLTGWISLQSMGLPRVFSNTTVQKHQFFGTQLSL